MSQHTRPVIYNISPQSGPVGTLVKIEGENFVVGNTYVSIGGVSHTPTDVTKTRMYVKIDDVTNAIEIVIATPGGSIKSNNVNFRFDYPPTISSFTPTAGAGETVTILGTNFTDASVVKFGGTAAASYSAVNSTSITAVLGSGATGQIEVTTPSGTVTSTGTFTYIHPPPTITFVNPTRGPVNTTLTIKGTNFINVSSVKIGATSLSFNPIDETHITALVTGISTQGVITVITPYGSVATLTSFEIIIPPTISSVMPSRGGAGPTPVTILGTNFTDASVVKFGGTNATSFTVVSATSITAVVASGTTGQIAVTNPAGTATSDVTFTFIPPPTITSVTPSTSGAGVTVKITGTNFIDDTSTKLELKIGGITRTARHVLDPETIKATIPHMTSSGQKQIYIKTLGGEATVDNIFTFIPPPTITSFTPTAGAGETVTITGTNFTDASVVKFGGINATSFTVDSPIKITAVVGSGATGQIEVTTPGTTPGALATSTETFTFIPAPTITSFTPASDVAGATIKITGTNFTGATAVTIGGTAVTSFTVVNSTSITIISDESSGNIFVATPGGTVTSLGEFKLIYNPGTPTFRTTLQKVSGSINEENIIDDTIFELASVDEIDTLFMLYDKLKKNISPGIILKSGTDKISILNEAEYKTHAYLVANSKNFLTGASFLYSIDEVNAVLLQLDTLKSRLIELEAQFKATTNIISSVGGVISGTNTSLSEFLQSGDNIEKYSESLVNLCNTFNNFTTGSIDNIISGLMVEYNITNNLNNPPV